MLNEIIHYEKWGWGYVVRTCVHKKNKEFLRALVMESGQSFNRCFYVLYTKSEIINTVAAQQDG